MRLALGIATTIALFDQLSKWWILSSIPDSVPPVAVTGFLNLVLARNRGVSFGLFDIDAAFGPWLFSGLALAIVAALLYWLSGIGQRRPAAAIGLIVGGAVGNVIDRLRFGAVIDFLDFHWAEIHWPAFNLADTAITLGVAVLLLDGLFASRKSPK